MTTALKGSALILTWACNPAGRGSAVEIRLFLLNCEKCYEVLDTSASFSPLGTSGRSCRQSRELRRFAPGATGRGEPVGASTCSTCPHMSALCAQVLIALLLNQVLLLVCKLHLRNRCKV